MHSGYDTESSNPSFQKRLIVTVEQAWQKMPEQKDRQNEQILT